MRDWFDIAAAAPGLQAGPDGIWMARSAEVVSYPEGGNANCLALEEESFWFPHRNHCIEALLGHYPPAGMLFDIGGGNGYVAAGLNRAGFATALLEPGWDGVRNARSRGVQPLIWATLEAAQFHPRVLPAAGLFDVVEHIQDDAGFLAIIQNILVPGGRLYVTVPAFQWLWSAVDEYSGHARRYTRASLHRLLEQVGFQVEYSSYLFPLLPLPMLFQRLLPVALGLREVNDWGGYHSEHAPRSGPVGALLTRLLAWELAQVRRGRVLPFGSSVVAVARKAS